jgi:hypothetical protein
MYDHCCALSRRHGIKTGLRQVEQDAIQMDARTQRVVGGTFTTITLTPPPEYEHCSQRARFHLLPVPDVSPLDSASRTGRFWEFLG